MAQLLCPGATADGGDRGVEIFMSGHTHKMPPKSLRARMHERQYKIGIPQGLASFELIRPPLSLFMSVSTSISSWDFLQAEAAERYQSFTRLSHGVHPL